MLKYFLAFKSNWGLINIGFHRYCHQKVTVWSHKICSGLNFLTDITNNISCVTNLIWKISSTFWYYKLTEFGPFQDCSTDIALKKWLLYSITLFLVWIFLHYEYHLLCHQSDLENISSAFWHWEVIESCHHQFSL